MVAVIVYFWRDWTEIIVSGVRDIARHRWEIAEWAWPSRLGLMIALGTVPAVIVGLLFADRIDRSLREPEVVGVALIVGGIVIWLVDRWGATIGRITRYETKEYVGGTRIVDLDASGGSADVIDEERG